MKGNVVVYSVLGEEIVLLLGGGVMFLGHNNITQLLIFTLPTLISNLPFCKWMTRSLDLHVGAFTSFHHRTLQPACKLTLLGTYPYEWWVTDLTILEVLLDPSFWVPNLNFHIRNWVGFKHCKAAMWQY